MGDLGTGKTSILRRFVHNTFTSHYKSTIGVDFALKVIQHKSDVIINLQLWDIAGQERFGSMTRAYYKGAVGAFVVYDVTRPTTFENVLKWKRDMDDKIKLPGGEDIPVMLLANKVIIPLLSMALILFLLTVQLRLIKVQIRKTESRWINSVKKLDLFNGNSCHKDIFIHRVNGYD